MATVMSDETKVKKQDAWKKCYNSRSTNLISEKRPTCVLYSKSIDIRVGILDINTEILIQLLI